MAQCAAIGTYGAFAVNITDGALAWGPSSKQFEYLEESIALTTELAGGGGIRGTRSRNGDRNRVVARRVSGTVTMEPTPVELAVWLPLIMGVGSQSGNTFSLTEDLPEFALLVDKIVKRFGYSYCKVSKARILGSQKQPLRMVLEIEGRDEVQYVNSFASYSVPAIDGGKPYVFADGSLEIGGEPFSMRSFEIMIDNVLETDRYLNDGQVRVCIPATDRVVTLQVEVPWTDTSNQILHDMSDEGLPGELAYTLGGQSTLFSFAKLQAPSRTPSTKRRDELTLQLQFQAMSESVANDELVITHDSTP